MTVRDFAAKKACEIRREGPARAIRTGVHEVSSKAYAPISAWRSTPIWDAEWDICLVLDACRYDLWCAVAPRFGFDATAGWSVGSASVEWLNETFADRHRDGWERTGYVTGNPHTAKTPDFGPFTDASVYPLADRGLPYLDEVWVDQWNVDEFETVRPEIMTSRGLYAWANRERYDFDQLVVHYMQPHIPFRSGEWTEGWKNTLAFGEHPQDSDAKGDWEKLRDGEVESGRFWRAYVDNLEWVLGEVLEWQARSDGTILVTADHGNAAGECGLWGHPPGSPCPALRKVPWVKIDGEGKWPAAPEPPGEPPVIAAKHTDDEWAESDLGDRLSALGYREPL